MRQTSNSSLAEVILPNQFTRIRDWVNRHIPCVVETTDRRGFQLQQWAQAQMNTQQKPIELSLEHEVRLLPIDLTALANLQEQLYKSEGIRSGIHLLPTASSFRDLVVKHYARNPGFQSVDHYYDTDDYEMTRKLITVRRRIKSSSFMTWAGGEGSSALNMELPFIPFGSSGLTVRLEFNWIDEITESWNLFLAGNVADRDLLFINPFYIANEHVLLPSTPIKAAIEHTTFREKFGFYEEGADGTAQELFVLNIDHVIAQSLINHRINTYTDIDLSAVQVMDQARINALEELATELRDIYMLQPNLSTKAHRDAQCLGIFS